MTFLRPDRIVLGDEHTWLVDGVHPAAVAIAADGDVAVHTWASPARGEATEARDCLADGVGIVVLEDDTLVWVRPDVPVSFAGVPSGLHLVAADDRTAWLVDGNHPPFADGGDQNGDSGGLIVAVTRDGTVHAVRTARPVARVLLTPGADDVEVRFAEQPTVTPFDDGPGGGAVAYPESAAHVARASLLAAHTLEVVPEYLPETAVPAIDLLDVEDDLRWAWLETDPVRVLAGGERLGESLWWFGADTGGSAVDRQVLVVAHDPATGAPRRTLTAGEGTVQTVARVGDELWFIVNRMQFLRVGRDDGVEVLALAADGTIRTVLAPESVDIGSFEPLLVPRPEEAEIAAHVAASREVFADLEHFWRDRSGWAHPLSDGLEDMGTAVEGDWPTTVLLVRLRHPSRPGLLLQRRFGLYDERGRPVALDDATIEIMEDLDTGYLPPVTKAIDGVLEF